MKREQQLIAVITHESIKQLTSQLCRFKTSIPGQNLAKAFKATSLTFLQPEQRRREKEA
jgi:hypothetical protein